MTTPLVRNSLSPSPLWRRVLFTVSAAALVALAVASQPLAHARTIPTSTPTPTPPQFNLLTTVPLQSNAQLAVTVNRALNKIYTSGGAAFGQDVEVIDGGTFATTDIGTGSGASVDNRTNRYWAATVFGQSVIVRDGASNAVIATVPIPGGYCPIQTNYDFFKKRVWLTAQCAAFHDPIFAVDAKTLGIIAGPIDSGGLILNTGFIANGANGRLYFSDEDGGAPPFISKRVDPTTFAVTVNAFGIVKAIDALTNTLYAVPDGTNNLQIINGKPDPEVILKTIPLPYAPGAIGINTALNHLYLANPAAQSIEVRDPVKGKLITTFSLSPFGLTPDGSMAVDSLRSRIYVISYTPSSQLLVIEDLITAFGPDCILSH